MLDHFTKIIAENDSYTTSIPAKKNILGTTLSFYRRLAGIVVKSNRLANRGEYNDYEWVESSLNVLDALEKSGVKVIVEGLENFKKFDGPAVIISNHMSTLETMVPVAIIHPVKRFVYVIKQELSTYPLFGKVVMARNPIVVGRSNPREDLKIVMDEGAKRIENGKSILIFPQKTRSVLFKTKEFNSLGVKLAKRNNVPVIPMAVLTDAWGNGKRLKDFGKIDNNKTVYISFGEPIKVESGGQVEHEHVLDFIEQKLEQWGRGELVIKE